MISKTRRWKTLILTSAAGLLCSLSFSQQPAAVPAPPKAPEGAKAEDAPAACLKCHAPIAALMAKKFKHAAMEGGCESCHVNHRDRKAAEGANGKPYLSDKQAALCGMCHDLADKKIASAHKGQPFETALCSGCHNPHGSDEPKLMEEKAHAPFAGRDCESCHKAPKEGKVMLAESTTAKLCFGCHPDVEEKYTKAKHKHTLLKTDENSCTDCHDPHASSHPKALKQSPAQLCAACHTDVTAGKKFVHQPVADSCVTCHDAHGSDFAKNLHADPQAVCLECHNQAGSEKFAGNEEIPLFGGKVKLPAKPYAELKLVELKSGRFGHPTNTHPVYVDAKGDKPGLNCLSCHRPHAADGVQQLLVTESDSTMALCARCHK